MMKKQILLFFMTIIGFFMILGCGDASFVPVILPTPQEYNIERGYCSLENLSNVEEGVDNSLPSEGYELVIDRKGVKISASAERGFIYARQSLELIRLQTEKNGGKTPCLTIKDAPRHSWRSFMLDSGRQYQKPETIRKFIDLLSLLKFNVFHWHLTEGLGWRVEIESHPKLTSVGSSVGSLPEQQGYYSQEEIREIVQYALAKGITIVPEIDMPGHAEAAIIAYPELSCFGEKITSPEKGFTYQIFCAGKDNTIKVLKEVLDEVCDLFPSEYIHLGGDEAPKKNWDKCPDCQRRIKKMGLKDSHDLQLWFSAEMANHLAEKGRKAIFWGDVVYKKGYALPENVAIHWWNWRGHKDKAYKEALERGLEVICGTNYYTYLNFPLTPWSGYKEGRTFDIQDLYEKNPSSNREGNPLVIGMAGALWTDYNVQEHMIYRRVLPRILGLAEQMWYKNEYRVFDDFYRDVNILKPYIEGLGYEFGPGLKSEVPEGYKWD